MNIYEWFLDPSIFHPFEGDDLLARHGGSEGPRHPRGPGGWRDRGGRA